MLDTRVSKQFIAHFVVRRLSIKELSEMQRIEEMRLRVFLSGAPITKVNKSWPVIWTTYKGAPAYCLCRCITLLPSFSDSFSTFPLNKFFCYLFYPHVSPFYTVQTRLLQWQFFLQRTFAFHLKND